ncbi:MAG: 30S ribosomal protein S2, partial [Nanoarchaeota archaeon]|nr:30S ribosomal protein S2 [Nanoarchaeota archaeon]
MVTKKKTEEEETVEANVDSDEKVVEKKEKETKEKKDANTLVPLDDYVKAGIYIGTKVITPHMRKYVYRRRNDGIAILNTNLIDEKLKEAIDFISKYNPDEFVVVCKREAGWRAVKLFSELTGVRVFTKKYPAGILTNTDLPDFFETGMVMICDPWIDKNALNDGNKVKSKISGLCDTNNLTNGIDVIVPCNNKSNKSLGLIFYILTREYVKAKKIDVKVPDMEEFIGEKLEELPMKKEKHKEDSLDKDKEKINKLLEAAGEEAEYGV